MELLQLKYFCALARNQHLTKTAEQLMISPSSLSATISKLEKDLNVQLFDRVGRNIRLNHSGEVFYAYASRIFSELENAQKELQDISCNEQYTIHVGISSLIIWQSALEQFQEEYPNIKLDYFFLSPFELLNSDDSLDFFLGVSRDIPAAQYNIEKVRAPEKPVAVVSCHHALAGSNSINLLQLQNDTLLSIGEGNPSAHKYILDMCAAAGFIPAKILEVDYFFRLKMLLDNRGVAITTDLGAKSIITDPSKVCIIPITSPYKTRIQSIAWKKNRYLSKGAIIFRDFIIDYFKNKPN